MNNDLANDLVNENHKLRNELDIYIKENEELKNNINILTAENNKLNNDLFKANKIIANINNTQNIPKENNNQIEYLNELIKIKNKEINELKEKLQNSANNNKSVNFNDIMVINFITADQTINCGIQCLKTETFAEVEERLYQQYEQYRETNNNFLAKGGLVLRFKKICENNIKNQDKVQLVKIE